MFRVMKAVKCYIFTIELYEDSGPFILQGLVQLELLCKQLYETADSTVRSEAEKTLIQFASSSDCLSRCQLLLERGNVRKFEI